MRGDGNVLAASAVAFVLALIEAAPGGGLFDLVVSYALMFAAGGAFIGGLMLKFDGPPARSDGEPGEGA